jgi:hypothetical protein
MTRLGKSHLQISEFILEFGWRYSFNSGRYACQQRDVYDDFINLEVQPIQSLGGTHKSRITYVHLYRGECTYIYMSAYAYTIFRNLEAFKTFIELTHHRVEACVHADDPQLF